MRLQYAMHLFAYRVSRHCLSSYAGAHRHDLQSDDSHLSVGQILTVVGIYFGQEVYVWVEPNTDTVDEQDRESCLRGVWPVPVSQTSCRGGMGAEEGKRA